jgi:hypothetical protein
MAASAAWRRRTAGMLTTAGGLLFAGDGAGNLVAYDPSLC